MIQQKDLLYLYKFHKELNQPFDSSYKLIVHALGLIANQLKLDTLSFFLWDPAESVLSLKLAWRYGVCMELEEYIEVDESSRLYEVIENQKTLVSGSPLYNGVYIPLQWGEAAKAGLSGQTHRLRARHSGAIRLERRKNSKMFTRKEIEFVKGLVEEMAQNFYQAELDQSSREQLRRLTALTELTEIFATSLRVNDGLRLILQGIRQSFGFDRVRLYLVDKEANKLKGELSADIWGHVRSLSYEEIPLEAGSHRFADIILGKSPENFAERYKDSVIYLPLTVQSETIGLLMLDTLLSQQPILHDDLVMIKSFAGQIALAVDNSRLFEKVQELSLYDELTRLPMRRFFFERLQAEVYRAERFKQPMALIWMDVDYLKEINDTYGHLIGDHALKEVSRVVLGNLRKIDFPCRYGGDEILILLPQARAAEAKAIASRLAVQSSEIRIPVAFSKTGEVRLTVSQGIATFPDDAGSQEELLQKADEALYWVKSHGKGAIALYGDVIKGTVNGRGETVEGEKKGNN